MAISRSNHSLAKRLGLVSALAVGLAAGAALAPPGPMFWSGGEARAEAVKPFGGPASFSPVVKAVAPAVVHIEVTQRAASADGPSAKDMPPAMREYFERFFGERMPHGQPGQRGPQQPRMGLGSGFFIDAAGYIVTNNHVVAGADKIVVTIKDGDKFDAKLIGVDSRTDLALLKVERAKPFPYVDFGDSDKAEVGDWVVAVGNPFGLDHTVTTGIISARGRSIGAGPYDDFLQLDAPINKGNSGGPAFNLSGEVIGVNTAIFSPTGGSVGIGFAIPSNMAKNVISQLKEKGSVERGWLGVAIQMVTQDIADGVGLKQAKGAIVSSVTADGPAAKAGVKVGDVIMEVNDARIEEMTELPRVIAALAPDQTAKVVVWRDGKERTLDVKLGSLPDEAALAARTEPDVAKPEELGLTLAPLDDASRRAAGMAEDLPGVLIAGIDPNSPLAAKGVKPGAVLLAVAGEPVESPDQASERIHAAGESGRSMVLLLIRQSGSERFFTAPLKKD